MSRFFGLAITGLAVYLAINSLPDFSSRDSHMTAVAIATDNREGIAAELNAAPAPRRSFSAANPLMAQPKLVSEPKLATTTGTATTPTGTRSADTASSTATPVWKVITEKLISADTKVAAAPKQDATYTGADIFNEKTTAQNVELASTDSYDDIQPVLLKTPELAQPKPEDILRETQRELKRVGCYRSRVDGIWGKGSRKALSKYVQKAPTSSRKTKVSYNGHPSIALLGQLRKTSTRVCGRPCGSGKMLSSSGQCINDPVITASLAPVNPWAASVATSKPVITPSNKKAKKSRATSRVKAKKKASKKLRRKWRKKRYALGGPSRIIKRKAKKRKYSRRYRYVRRHKRRSWKQKALFPIY